MVVTYVDALDLLREVFGADDELAALCVFDGWLDLGRYGQPWTPSHARLPASLGGEAG